MTWRFAPEETPPEPVLVSPRVRAHLTGGTRHQVLAAIVKVARSDPDPRRRRENVSAAADLARKNPALDGHLEQALVRAASQGHKVDVTALVDRATLVVDGPPRPVVRTPAPARPAPQVKVRVRKGTKVRTVRQARRATTPHRGRMTTKTDTPTTAADSFAQLVAAMHWRGPGSAEAVVEKLNEHHARFGVATE